MSHEIKGYVAAPGRELPKPYVELMDTLESLDKRSNDMALLLPRHERFALAHEIKNSMNQIRRHAVSSYVLHKKLTALRNLDLEKEILHSWASKCLRLGYITPGQSKEWSLLINQLGRQIGGWIIYEKSKMAGSR